MSAWTMLRIVAAWALWLAVMPSASAADRALKAKAHNYPNTPVEVRQVKVALVETYATPTQASAQETGARRSRVRYANRAGLTPATLVLSGELLLANHAGQPVEALALTIVLLDAFHQPLQVPGQRDTFTVQQVVAAMPKGSTKRIQWEQRVHSADIYEVAVLVTRVRFTDASVWLAPREELIDIF